MIKTIAKPVIAATTTGLWPLLALSLCLAAGCASKEPPLQTFGQAQEAVNQASQSKAPEYSTGELATAKSKLAQADKELQLGNYTVARRLSEQAMVDAQLAEVRAEAQADAEAAQALQSSIQTLRQEINKPRS